MLENMECEKISYKKDENVKKITMKRIAEEASVSVSCVARCVNNSGYVAEEKRRRISEVMDRLHYIPNQQAKCLRDGCSKLIGHIHVTSEENIFFVPEIARWQFIASHAHSSEIGTVLDEAMREIEKDNPSLENVLPQNYASQI